MTYIIAGATGTTGRAIATELASTDKVHLIGRDESALIELADNLNSSYSLIDIENPIPVKEFQQTVEIEKT